MSKYISKQIWESDYTKLESLIEQRTRLQNLNEEYAKVVGFSSKDLISRITAIEGNIAALVLIFIATNQQGTSQ